MEKPYLDSLEEKEREVLSEVVSRFEGEMEVAYAALEYVVSTFHEAISKQPETPEDLGRLLLLSRSINSLRAALKLWPCGFYQQVTALVRMAMEDVLIASDINNPETLKALLFGEGKIGRGKLTLSEIAQRLSGKYSSEFPESSELFSELKERWYSSYRMASESSVHPRSTNIYEAVKLDADEDQIQMYIYPGIYLGKGRAADALRSILVQLIWLLLIALDVALHFYKSRSERKEWMDGADTLRIALEMAYERAEDYAMENKWSGDWLDLGKASS